MGDPTSTNPLLWVSESGPQEHAKAPSSDLLHEKLKDMLATHAGMGRFGGLATEAGPGSFHRKRHSEWPRRVEVTSIVEPDAYTRGQGRRTRSSTNSS